MSELLALQQEGNQVHDPDRLLLKAGDLTTPHSEDTFPGHAAWLDWPWKLHRIQNEDPPGLKFELYNLQDDSMETKDLLEAEPAKAARMKADLERWLGSVARSLNGRDYPAVSPH